MERHFEHQLTELQSKVLRMASLAEEQVRAATKAFLERDAGLARGVFESDHSIDAMENEIEEAGIHLLATQQPMARDLRLISMILKMSSDLERVGDHAVNIVESTLRLQGAPAIEPPPEVGAMTEIALEMLRGAVDAFVERDARSAVEILRRDDVVDRYNDSVFRILLTVMMENPRRISWGMEVLLVSRNLERIADMATNIAEDVIYIVEARNVKHHASDMQESSPVAAPVAQGTADA
ncbi:MAG TPA: phosphate signaling complex protein PhoU [Gemmatimonadota bacterium]